MKRDTEWLITHAYVMEHSTDHKYVNLRRLECFEQWAMGALHEIVPRGHHYNTGLRDIYIDLLDAHFIAERARPITMEGMSYGEWVRWYEINIMPTLKPED